MISRKFKYFKTISETLVVFLFAKREEMSCMKMKKYLAIIAGICLMLLFGGTIYAMTSVEVTNHFETGIVDISLTEYQKNNGTEELWKDNPTILPGDQISKIPRIYNNGNDCYVRAKLTFRDMEEIGEQNLYGIDETWVKADDGYYYYTNILPHGESVDIFEGIKIPTDFSQENEEKIFYIDIDVDAIQSKNFTPQYDMSAPWGSVEILKCEKEGQYDISTFRQSDTKSFEIKYEGDSKKLIKNSEDFFGNIPYLMPGDKYSDSVEFVNTGNEAIALYFRSEAADDSELLEKILLKITTNIAGEQRVVYSGNLKATELSKDSILGIIPENAEGYFDFEIEMPETLNNKYSIQSSYIKWIFSAEDVTDTVDVEKSTIAITQMNDTFKYTIDTIHNKLSTSVEDFTVTDVLPEEVRLTVLYTGTYNAEGTLKVEYRTNKNHKWKTWKNGISTLKAERLSVSDLGLPEGEYITEFRMLFGEVKSQFRNVTAPVYLVTVVDYGDGEIRNTISLRGTKMNYTFTDEDTTVTKLYRNTISGHPVTSGAEKPQYEITGEENAVTGNGNSSITANMRNTPKTGDDSQIIIWGILLASAFCGFIVIRKKKIRSNK